MLTTRQWTLYRLIKANSEQGKWTSQDEVLSLLNENNLPVGYKKSEGGHDKCTTIWQDIDTINFSPEIEKIIIKDGLKNYKLATTPVEAMEYASKFMLKGLKALKRYWTIADKVKSDGQGKLISTQDKVIDDNSRARAFVEAFIKCHEELSQ